MMVVILFLLGIGVGLFTGLLGIGGGVLMVPALMFIPPFFGLDGVAIKLATGTAAVQGLAGTTSGTWVHWKNGSLNIKLTLQLGVFTMMGALLGSLHSGVYSESVIKWIFLLAVALVIMISFKRPVPPEFEEPTQEIGLNLGSKTIGAMLVFMAIGYLSGILGIGGAAFMIPIMYTIMGLPTRIAIACGSGMVWLTSLATVCGKWQVGQIDIVYAVAVTLGALIGGAIGARLSHKTPEKLLRGCFLFLLITVLIRTLMELIL